MNEIEFKIVNPLLYQLPNNGIPKYATTDSAAVDLRACVKEPVIVEGGERVLIGTGFAIHINNPFVAALLIPRSGLGHKEGIILGNSIGLLDGDYQGEVKMSCWNTTIYDFVVDPYMRLAQLLFVNITCPKFKEVKEFSVKSERGEGGFGSTGTN